MNREFYARGVVEVARDLVGCVLRHGETAGVIVETEAYHETEPACHAFVGLTPRTSSACGPTATDRSWPPSAAPRSTCATRRWSASCC